MAPHILNEAQLKQLQGFISLIKVNPQFLHHDELSFFRSYLESLGAQIPEPTKPTTDMNDPNPPATETEPESVPKEPEDAKPTEPVPEESEESDVELDNTGVIGNHHSLCFLINSQ